MDLTQTSKGNVILLLMKTLMIALPVHA